MPPLSIWFVRTSLVNLIVGLTFGALMLANKGAPFDARMWRLRPAHMEFLLVGWLIQLAMGVAFWIAPRWWEPPRRGNVTGAYAAFGLLNGGLWLVVLSTFLGLPEGWRFAGRLLEAAAAGAFLWHLWPRIVGREG